MLSSPPPYQLAGEEVVLAFDSDRQRGLNAEQVHERLVEFGPNALQATPPPTPLDIFLAQFKEPLVLVLVAATLVSATPVLILFFMFGKRIVNSIGFNGTK